MEVNWYTGLEPGKTLRPYVSPSSSPASQFTPTVPIHPDWKCTQPEMEATSILTFNDLKKTQGPEPQRNCLQYEMLRNFVALFVKKL